MKIALEQAATERIDDLIRTLDRFTAALKANTAAIEARNALVDAEQNGPRG